MKKIILLLAFCVTIAAFPGCGSDNGSSSEKNSSEVATVAPVEVVEEGMIPLYGSSLRDGTYNVKVDSSSSMFNITACELTVKDGSMTAKMTMSGTGYLHLFMGTSQEAAEADSSSYIPYSEENGVHSFTVPVEALDMGIPCAAFSKNKEQWYDRTILFRADSLPADAYADGALKTVESLSLIDGEYNVGVTLGGGSGKASVGSPASLVVREGKAFARIVWSSSSYDYMVVDGEKYFALSNENGSEFEIPVSAFDIKLSVLADTTAMSQPYEIEYTLFFDSTTITKK